MRKLALSFVAGVVVTLGYLYYLGPEVLIQSGMKIAAAQTNYDWRAIPRETTPVSYSTRDLIAQSDPAPTAKAKVRR